jgi:hypothetical protein
MSLLGLLCVDRFDANLDDMEMIQNLLMTLLQKQPWFATVIAVMGTARLIAKPIMTAIREVIKATPTQVDDSALSKFEQSKIYKGLCFVVDWLFSVKLPGAK